MAHWKVGQKSSQREVIRKNVCIASKPQSVLLPALHLKFSRSLTTFQASQARQSFLKSRDRCSNHAVVWIAAGIERWQTVHFQLSKPDNKTRTAYNSTAGRGDEGKRNFRGPKWQLLLQNERLFKASTASLISQPHAREKWRRCGNHIYQKIRLECTQVAIDRNRSMASQRVNNSFIVLPWWSKDLENFVENLLHLVIDQHPVCPIATRAMAWTLTSEMVPLGRHPWR